MDFRDALVVALEEALQDLGKEDPLGHADAAHDAEIHQHQAPVRREDHVPFVQVGMEEAVIQRAGEEAARDPVGKIDAVIGADRAGIGQRAALDPFGDQNALARALPVDLRREDVIVERCDLAEFGSGARLEPQVHLAGERAAPWCR